MKIEQIGIALIIIPIIIACILLCTLSYANHWGNRECLKAGGNWIMLNRGRHCVDKDFKEIDIYNKPFN